MDTATNGAGGWLPYLQMKAKVASVIEISALAITRKAPSSSLVDSLFPSSKAKLPFKGIGKIRNPAVSCTLSLVLVRFWFDSAHVS